jgi:hypothetical protein
MAAHLQIRSIDWTGKGCTRTEFWVDRNTKNLEVEIEVVIDSYILCSCPTAFAFRLAVHRRTRTHQIIQDDLVRIRSRGIATFSRRDRDCKNATHLKVNGKSKVEAV